MTQFPDQPFTMQYTFWANDTDFFAPLDGNHSCDKRVAQLLQNAICELESHKTKGLDYEISLFFPFEVKRLPPMGGNKLDDGSVGSEPAFIVRVQSKNKGDFVTALNRIINDAEIGAVFQCITKYRKECSFMFYKTDHVFPSSTVSFENYLEVSILQPNEFFDVGNEFPDGKFCVSETFWAKDDCVSIALKVQAWIIAKCNHFYPYGNIGLDIPFHVDPLIDGKFPGTVGDMPTYQFNVTYEDKSMWQFYLKKQWESTAFKAARVILNGCCKKFTRDFMKCQFNSNELT